MKNFIKTGLLLFSVTTIPYIYPNNYSFFNHTDKQIAIAIQFRGAEKEPLYPKLIKAQSKETFEEGNHDIPAIKANFCLHHIYYVKEPTALHKKDKYTNAPWKEITINWVNSKDYDQLIQSRDIAAIKKNTPINKHQSLCQDRHFDIIEDKNGKLYIISRVTID